MARLSGRVHPRLAAVPCPYSQRVMLICVGPHVDDTAVTSWPHDDNRSNRADGNHYRALPDGRPRVQPPRLRPARGKVNAVLCQCFGQFTYLCVPRGHHRAGMIQFGVLRGCQPALRVQRPHHFAAHVHFGLTVRSPSHQTLVRHLDHGIAIDQPPTHVRGCRGLRPAAQRERAQDYHQCCGTHRSHGI
jgi:hypothetical protein